MVLACDAGDREQVDATVGAVRNAWGEVEVLINNAGIIQVGPQEEMTLEDYEQAMRVHFWGALHFILAVLPAMRRRRGGRIVNIASIGGQISVPHLLPYCASKFALVGLSEGLRAELIRHRVYVTTVYPGLMRTGSAPHALFKGRHDAECAWFRIGASAPLASMNAERAADQVLAACRNGRGTVVLALPAKLASLFHGVAPATVGEAMGLVNRWLPEPGGIGSESRTGRQSRPEWLPDWVTRLGDRAAVRNNELKPGATSR